MRSEIRPVITITAAGYILAGALLLLLYESPTSHLPAFLLLWFWPAVAWIMYLDGPLVERIVVASGLSFLLIAMVVLLLSYLPGALRPGMMFAGVSLVFLIPTALVWRRGSIPRIDLLGSRKHWMAVTAVVLAALALRFVNLQYKEFQGDEGVIMVRAASMITGDEAEIFLHQKGPVEIVIPAAVWSITGLIDDYWSRLPFTWTGLLVVVAIYWLARMWFGQKAGIIAGLLMAIGGFGIAFSRIVQYQSFVMLWGALALMLATRYREDSRRRDLVLAAMFLAAGLLAHYDAILVLPAFLWILGERMVKERRVDIKTLLPAVAAAGIMVALFYVPYATGPNAGRTFSYLLADRVTVSEDTSFLGWSGRAVWQMMTFYNSIWYVLGLLILSLMGIVLSFRRRRELASTLYLLVPTVFYLFVVGDPRTHVYTIVPGAVILSGFAAGEIWEVITAANRKNLKPAVAAFAMPWLVVVTIYPILMFVDISEERQRTWLENRPLPLLYPVTWEEPPEYGLFGFPHQAGWRAALDRLGSDAYPYSSNEEEEITNWYMAQRPRTHCADARALLITANPQDAVQIDPEFLQGYQLQEEILVGDQVGLQVLARGGVDEVARVNSADYSRWLKPSDAVPSTYAGEHPVNASFGRKARLLGHDLDLTDSRPGGNITVVLYWEALESFDRNVQVFVHLYDGIMRAQHDGAPECAINPTTRWEPGQIVPDPHTIQLPEDLELESVPLLVGMYDLVTKDRLEVDGTDLDYVYLTDVDITQSDR